MRTLLSRLLGRRADDYVAPAVTVEENEPTRRAQALVVLLRRGEDPSAWLSFRDLVQREVEAICRGSTTRQLISLCDTFADYGDPLERRNALLISLLGNMEKVGQSFLLWRTGYRRPFEVAPGIEPRKVGLWDGMDTFHLDIGDVTNNQFARLTRMLADTPVLQRIYNTVVDRLRAGPTLLSALNERHGHVFETDTRWRAHPKYHPFRDSGQIPPWKNDGA